MELSKHVIPLPVASSLFEPNEIHRLQVICGVEDNDLSSVPPNLYAYRTSKLQE